MAPNIPVGVRGKSGPDQDTSNDHPYLAVRKIDHHWEAWIARKNGGWHTCVSALTRSGVIRKGTRRARRYYRPESPVEYIDIPNAIGAA